MGSWKPSGLEVTRSGFAISLRAALSDPLSVTLGLSLHLSIAASQDGGGSERLESEKALDPALPLTVKTEGSNSAKAPRPSGASSSANCPHPSPEHRASPGLVPAPPHPAPRPGPPSCPRSRPPRGAGLTQKRKSLA